LEDAANMNHLEGGNLFDPLDPLDPTDPTHDTSEWDIMDDDRRTDDWTDEELWDEAMGGLLESVMIIGLTFLLAVLLIWRRAREDTAEQARRRAREQEQGQAQEGHEQVQDGNEGVFPNRNDPEFMNWAVGGVGH
jgi:SEL1 protein